MTSQFPARGLPLTSSRCWHYFAHLCSSTETAADMDGDSSAPAATAAADLNSFKKEDLIQMVQKLMRSDEEDRRSREEEKRLFEEMRRSNEEVMRLSKLSIGVGMLVEHGLPELGSHNLSTTEHPNFGIHPPYYDVELTVQKKADLTIRQDHTIEALSIMEKPSYIWRSTSLSAGLGKLPPWSCEAEIQGHVQNVIRDAIDLSGVKNLTVFQEVGLSVTDRLRPDLVVFRSEGVVVGLCKVKKPTREGGILSNNQLRNQIANYMLTAKHCHGLRKPFGIITTYNEWKFCWFKDDPAALDSTRSCPEILCETRTFRYNEPALVEALVSVVSEMSKSIIEPPTSFLGRGQRKGGLTERIDVRKYGFVDRIGFKWSALPSGLENLSFELPTARTKSFFLLEDFHGGADGRVWLAMNSSGRLCVLKLSDSTNFIEEACAWKVAWNAADVRVVQLLNCNALMMPFAFHAFVEGSSVFFRGLHKWKSEDLSAESIMDSDVNAKFDKESVLHYYNNPRLVAEEALEALASKGFAHGDLHWRHVALLPVYDETKSLWKVKPILIDLTRLNACNEQERESIAQKGMLLLDRELIEL